MPQPVSTRPESRAPRDDLVDVNRHRHWPWFALAVAVLVVAGSGVVLVERYRSADVRRHYLDRIGWPSHGQAAYALGSGSVQASPGQQPVPIASVAKVMTAYVVLQHHPLADGRGGPLLTVTDADVVDTARRRRDGQSVVALHAGETLTERQALLAVLLPSANNVARLLARWSAGSVPVFVVEMNATARQLGMRHTRYTDPSGYAASTTSTAADQVLLARQAATSPTLTAMAGQRTTTIPVAGTVHNTDTLLGTDGFLGTKTGSDAAAGGCFMFRTERVIDRQVVEMIGVVLGQSGRHPIVAGLTAARELADRVGSAERG